MVHADTVGDFIKISHLQDRTVQCFSPTATWGSATLTLQGSNDPRVESDPANAVWATLRDPGGTALTFTADALGVRSILELPTYIRPSKAGGTGETVTVIINGRGDTR